MSNNEIVEILEQRFGFNNTLRFCEMKALAHKLELEDRKKHGITTDDCDDAYQADWWNNKYNEYIERYNEFGGNYGC